MVYVQFLNDIRCFSRKTGKSGGSVVSFDRFSNACFLLSGGNAFIPVAIYPLRVCGNDKIFIKITLKICIR